MFKPDPRIVLMTCLEFSGSNNVIMKFLPLTEVCATEVNGNSPSCVLTES